MRPIVAVLLRDLRFRVLGRRWTDAAANLTLATRGVDSSGLERLGEVSQPIVLYPPVVDPGGGRPWPERDDTFLWSGAFTDRSGSKPPWRSRQGESGADAERATDGRRLRGRSRVHDSHPAARGRYGEWIEFREDLSRAELNRVDGALAVCIRRWRTNTSAMARPR